MPEHLKALVVILAIAAAVFAVAERPLCALTTNVLDYRRRRNLWFAVTLIAFLSHNFWLYAVLCALLLAVYGARDRNPLALYALVLFAVPPVGAQIPGLGLVNYLFNLGPVRLLNLVILLPAAWSLMKTPADQRYGLAPG